MVNSQDAGSAQSPGGGLRRTLLAPRTLFGLVMSALLYGCAAMTLLPLLALLSYLVSQGVGRLHWRILIELPPPPLVEGGGFGPAVVGTLLLVAIASLLSLPLGILAALYLAEFSADQSLASWLRLATQVLSGVPSIVVGMFAYGVVVVATGKFSAVAGGFALSILMLPMIVRTAEDALRLVPSELRQAAVALGATQFQTVAGVVLPAAAPAIVTGMMLAIARAAGETAPLLFTALSTQFWPTGWLDPTPSLAVLIYDFARSPFENQRSLAWAAALVLVILVLITGVLARWVTRRSVR